MPPGACQAPARAQGAALGLPRLMPATDQGQILEAAQTCQRVFPWGHCPRDVGNSCIVQEGLGPLSLSVVAQGSAWDSSTTTPAQP